MKVATVFYDRLVFPVEPSMRDAAVKGWASDDGINLKEARAAFLTFEDVIPPPVAAELNRSMWDIDGIREQMYGSQGNGAATDSIADALWKMAFGDVAADHGVSVSELHDTNRFHPHDVGKDAYCSIFAALGAVRAASALAGYCTSSSLVAFSEVEVAVAQHGAAASSLTRFDDVYESVKLHVPSVRKLSWEAVFALRRDERVRDFRTWLRGRVDEQNGGDGDSVVNDLWKAVESLHPRPVEEIIKGVVGNVPLPPFIPVNPVGIATAVRDIHRSLAFPKEHRLVTFLHRMRKATEK